MATRLEEVSAAENVGADPLSLRLMCEALKDRYVERATEVELLGLVTVARVHMTLVGPPGNAKSQVVRDFCRSIKGASYFETLLAADSPAQRVLGPYSIPALDQGRFEFSTEGMLPEAHLALLDEGYRANATLLDNLLSVINERVLHNGPQVISVPLWTLVIACNQLPDPSDERTEAFRDRIALTRIVGPVTSDEGRRRIMLGQVSRRIGSTDEIPSVSREVVERLQDAVPKVALPEEFVNDALRLWRAGEDAGLPTSARRFGELVKLCQARALLAGRSECRSEDLTLAQHLLWVDPDDQPLAYEVTLGFASEWVRRAADLSRALSEYAPQVESVLERTQAIPPEEEMPTELTQESMNLSRRLFALEQRAEASRREAEAEGADASEIVRVENECHRSLRALKRAAFGIEE